MIQGNDLLIQRAKILPQIIAGQFSEHDGAYRIAGGPLLMDENIPVVDNLMRTRPRGIEIAHGFSLRTDMLPQVIRLAGQISKGFAPICSDERVIPNSYMYMNEDGFMHESCGAAGLVENNTSPRITPAEFIKMKLDNDYTFPGTSQPNTVPIHGHAATGVILSPAGYGIQPNHLLIMHKMGLGIPFIVSGPNENDLSEIYGKDRSSSQFETELEQFVLWTTGLLMTIAAGDHNGKEYKKYDAWRREALLAIEYANKAQALGLMAFDDGKLS